MMPVRGGAPVGAGEPPVGAGEGEYLPYAHRTTVHFRPRTTALVLNVHAPRVSASRYVYEGR